MIYRKIVIVGNVVDGLQFFGPFDTADEAGEWADGTNAEWTVADLLADDDA